MAPVITEADRGFQEELPNEIRTESLTPSVRYRIEVSGSLEFGDEAGENEAIENGTVDGVIGSRNAEDNYRYSGTITDFAITNGDADVFVNGEQVDDPTGLPDSSNQTSIVLEQNGQCIPVTPLTGDDPVEDLYEYTYPTDRFEGPPGVEGTSFSSEGTADLQRDATSILFLYDGPERLSLVVVHGLVEGATVGGTVSFTIDGLPAEGEWVVRDDDYLTGDGEQATSNYDRWDTDGEEHTIDWAYRDDRTDGGAFRGLDSEFEIRIEPAFNEAAALGTDHDFGPIETWELLSGNRDDPKRYDLELDQPVTLRRGECSS
jgi:hypothetical protein